MRKEGDFMEKIKTELTVNALFRHPERSIVFPYLSKCTYPWEALPFIAEWIMEIGKALPTDLYEQRGEDIWIAKSATVAPSACLNGPLIIGENAEIRHCAFLRGSIIVGNGAVVGNSTELKNCILFDGVQVPHYNYVGDSILGYCAHMGAGSVTSNVKGDKSLVTVAVAQERIATGCKKCGAMLGDGAEIGCHSVLNPGTVIGVDSQVYPLSSVRGYVPSEHIYKSGDKIVLKQK
jgi:NDP-sugar pyrophosphorylase family protein